MTALIFVLTLPAIIFPQNKVVVGATGEYQISIKPTHTLIQVELKAILTRVKTEN